MNRDVKDSSSNNINNDNNKNSSTISVVSRVPLHPRNPNHGTGVTAIANSCSAEEGFSSSSKDGSTRSSSTAAVLNRLSGVESSNNENNKRIFPSSAPTRSSATNSRDVVSPGLQETNLARGRSVERQVAASASRSTSAPRPSTDVPSMKHVASASSSGRDDSSDDSVIFEERRCRIEGDGYTTHQYLRGRLLGKGGFAKVYFCTALDTNKSYAVKIVPKANLVKARARQKLQAEIKIHRTLKHKHICEYKHFFEDRDNCYILLELCHNQSLNEMLKRRKRLTEPEARYFLAQLLQAVAYMHDQCVIHRDLKLGNLFLDRHMEIKVGDLGLATRLSHAEEKRKTICGTPNYIAPEVIQGSKETRGHSFEVDIWSMGVILFTFLVGKPPYEAKDVKSTYQRIIANEYSFPNEVPISEYAKDLIASMLQTNPADRPSLSDIARHPFLASNKVPLQLPANATHVAPEWHENEFGDVVPTDHRRKADHAAIGKKIDAALSSTRLNRRPFMSRDPNTDKAGITPTDDLSALKKHSDGAPEKVGKGTFTERAASSSTRFAIHDDFEPTPLQAAITDHCQKPLHLRGAPALHDEVELAARSSALSLRQMSPARLELASSESDAVIAASAVGTHKSEQDMLILKQIYERLTAVLEVTDCRKYYYSQSCSARPVTRGCPNKWVVRYVDYTSKYGLGFLLSDGSSGVYFNDSTKAVIEADGEVFQYVERQRAPGDQTVNSGPRRCEATTVIYTLSTFPKSLQKKVTLLKHFRNYLVEQQKHDFDNHNNTLPTHANLTATCELVYVKKWIRTKHAILFRLSDQTVQIVFYDQTEILLTPDERFVTFVEKTRIRSTYFLSDELVGCNEGLAKRLKYCKEILQQLLLNPR